MANLGNAFCARLLCADLDLIPHIRKDYAAYIALWREVLKNEKRAIFSGGACAESG